MPYSKEELTKLRSLLNTELRKELAEEFGLADKSIRNILSGSTKNDAVIAAGILKAKAYQDLLNSTKALLNAL
jgi:predicted transcriptional regulator